MKMSTAICFFRTAMIFFALVCLSACDEEELYRHEDIIDPTGLMGMADSPWPCDGHDSRRSSQSPYEGPDTCEVIWTYNTRPGIHVSDAISPVIDAEGNLYSMAWTRVVKLAPGGNLRWEADRGYYLRTMPTLGSDGTIYATGMYQASVTGFTQGGVFAISPEGQILWEFETEDEYDGGITGAATVAPDGTIYIADYSHCLYALSPGGSVRWKYQTDRMTASSPALNAEGTIVIVDSDDAVYAIFPDGKLKWKTQIDADTDYDPVISPDGTIYLGTENGIVAVSDRGNLLWEFPVEGGVWNRPAIGNDGTVVFGGGDTFIYALNTDGTGKWKYRTGDVISSTPTLDARGHVYIGSRDGFLYALTDTGTLKWRYELSIGYGQPTLDAGGTLYAGTWDGLVIAIGGTK